MVDPRVTDRDDGNGSSSYFQKTVMLKDWWLIKSHEVFEGKQFGVAGTERMASVERRAVRVFTSAPIVKAFDVFTLETSDGICILLKGFINKERTMKNGFSPEIFRHFIFGFPPCWEEISKECFEWSASCGTGVDSMSLRPDTDLSGCPVLTPCKNKEGNLEDECNPVFWRSKDEQQPSSSLTPAKTKNKNDIDETDDKDGRNKDSALPDVDMVVARENPGSKGRKTRTGSTKQGASSERIKLEQNSVRKSSRLQSKDVRKSPEIERKSSLTKGSNHAYDGHRRNSDGLNEAKSVDAEKDDNDGIKADLVSPEVDTIMSEEHSASQVDGFAKRRASPVSKDRIGRKNTTRESVRSARLKIKLDEIRTSPSLLSRDSEKTPETGMKGNSDKGVKSAYINGHLDPKYHCDTIPEEDESCVREEYPTGEKTKRRINFDLEVRKENTAVISPEILSCRRSRSGRLLVSTLEFWRNQVPVYDADRRIIGIKEGVDANTPPRGSGSESQRRGR